MNDLVDITALLTAGCLLAGDNQSQTLVKFLPEEALTFFFVALVTRIVEIMDVR